MSQPWQYLGVISERLIEQSLFTGHKVHRLGSSLQLRGSSTQSVSSASQMLSDDPKRLLAYLTIGHFVSRNVRPQSQEGEAHLPFRQEESYDRLATSRWLLGYAVRIALTFLLLQQAGRSAKPSIVPAFSHPGRVVLNAATTANSNI